MVKLPKEHTIIKGLMFRVVKKYIAGSTLEAALQAARENQGRGMHTTVTFLNDSVSDATKARYNANTYVQLAKQVSRLHLNTDISVRPSQLGYNAGNGAFEKCLADVVKAAEDSSTTLWLESEGAVPEEELFQIYRDARKQGKGIGMEIPIKYPLEVSAIRRNLKPSDMIKLTAHSAMQAEEVRRPKKARASDSDVITDRHLYELYISDIGKLLQAGVNVSVLEHDEKLVSRLAGFSKEYKKNLIFELPLGCSKKWLARLQKLKINLSLYTPYGKDWGPYLLNKITVRHGHIRDLAAKVLDTGAIEGVGANG